MAASKNFEIQKTDAEWQAVLSPEAFKVLRHESTERAGTSPLDKVYDSGTYACAGCGSALFNSDSKFNSGTGWPSFFLPIDGCGGAIQIRKRYFPFQHFAFDDLEHFHKLREDENFVLACVFFYFAKQFIGLYRFVYVHFFIFHQFGVVANLA